MQSPLPGNYRLLGHRFHHVRHAAPLCRLVDGWHVRDDTQFLLFRFWIDGKYIPANWAAIGHRSTGIFAWGIYGLLEARGGIEPPNKGFADLCSRRVNSAESVDQRGKLSVCPVFVRWVSRLMCARPVYARVHNKTRLCFFTSPTSGTNPKRATRQI